MVERESLPYRPCVGIMLLNREGKAFIGCRAPGGEEDVPKSPPWQMPQGGIDEGEDPYPAALRELFEETNVRSVEKLGESQDWHYYDLPPELLGVSWKGRYRGQKQKWFVLRFTGDDGEIDVLRPGGGAHKPEFFDWRWEDVANLPSLIVPFKRKTYEAVVGELARFAVPA